MDLDANQLNERGRELSGAGRPDEAIEAYQAAAAADPSWSVPWYNLGLVHKYRGEWHSSFEANKQAVLRSPEDEAAWWNLGIAATALGIWAEAREAWRRCGVDVPDGIGPIEGNYGLTPVRLAPATRAEVVWCERIDPARAIIRNVPLLESGYSFGDLILHDGAPNGYRLRDGIEVPVFDELERLRQSTFATFILDLPGSTPAIRDSLSDVAFRLGGAAEDWSESVSYLCRKCSEGRPHEHHDSDLQGTRPGLAVAAAARDLEHLDHIIASWRSESGYDGFVARLPANQT
jgi:hypothetical protein